jgi:hypothetical protein
MLPAPNSVNQLREANRRSQGLSGTRMLASIGFTNKVAAQGDSTVSRPRRWHWDAATSMRRDRTCTILCEFVPSRANSSNSPLSSHHSTAGERHGGVKQYAGSGSAEAVRPDGQVRDGRGSGGGCRLTRPGCAMPDTMRNMGEACTAANRSPVHEPRA